MNTIIEAGHYYAANGPSTISAMGWEIGKDLADDSPSAQLALLVDDYHSEQAFIEPGDTFFNQEEAARAIKALHEEADHVFSEAAIAGAAPQKMNELLENRLVKLRKGALTAAGVRLGSVEGSDITTFRPTCVFLDYMLLNEKATLGGNQITVLPEAYRPQQSQLATVLGKIAVPELVSYTNIFYELNSAGNVTFDEVVV